MLNLYRNTLKFRKLSTTHANKASLPTETVTFGIGSANRGSSDSGNIEYY
jgi:hypothetical protein